jgi:hypothetical protein
VTRLLAPLAPLVACGTATDEPDAPTDCAPVMPSLAWEDVPAGRIGRINPSQAALLPSLSRDVSAHTRNEFRVF